MGQKYILIHNFKLILGSIAIGDGVEKIVQSVTKFHTKL